MIKKVKKPNHPNHALIIRQARKKRLRKQLLHAGMIGTLALAEGGQVLANTQTAIQANSPAVHLQEEQKNQENQQELDAMLSEGKKKREDEETAEEVLDNEDQDEDDTSDEKEADTTEASSSNDEVFSAAPERSDSQSESSSEISSRAPEITFDDWFPIKDTFTAYTVGKVERTNGTLKVTITSAENISSGQFPNLTAWVYVPSEDRVVELGKFTYVSAGGHNSYTLTFANLPEDLSGNVRIYLVHGAYAQHHRRLTGDEGVTFVIPKLTEARVAQKSALTKTYDGNTDVTDNTDISKPSIEFNYNGTKTLELDISRENLRFQSPDADNTVAQIVDSGTKTAEQAVRDSINAQFSTMDSTAKERLVSFIMEENSSWELYNGLIKPFEIQRESISITQGHLEKVFDGNADVTSSNIETLPTVTFSGLPTDELSGGDLNLSDFEDLIKFNSANVHTGQTARFNSENLGIEQVKQILGIKTNNYIITANTAAWLSETPANDGSQPLFTSTITKRPFDVDNLELVERGSLFKVFDGNDSVTEKTTVGLPKINVTVLPSSSKEVELDFAHSLLRFAESGVHENKDGKLNLDDLSNSELLAILGISSSESNLEIDFDAIRAWLSDSKLYSSEITNHVINAEDIAIVETGLISKIYDTSDTFDAAKHESTAAKVSITGIPGQSSPADFKLDPTALQIKFANANVHSGFAIIDWIDVELKDLLDLPSNVALSEDAESKIKNDIIRSVITPRVITNLDDEDISVTQAKVNRDYDGTTSIAPTDVTGTPSITIDDKTFELDITDLTLTFADKNAKESVKVSVTGNLSLNDTNYKLDLDADNLSKLFAGSINQKKVEFTQGKIANKYFNGSPDIAVADVTLPEIETGVDGEKITFAGDIATLKHSQSQSTWNTDAAWPSSSPKLADANWGISHPGVNLDNYDFSDLPEPVETLDFIQPKLFVNPLFQPLLATGDQFDVNDLFEVGHIMALPGANLTPSAENTAHSITVSASLSKDNPEFYFENEKEILEDVTYRLYDADDNLLQTNATGIFTGLVADKAYSVTVQSDQSRNFEEGLEESEKLPIKTDEAKYVVDPSQATVITSGTVKTREYDGTTDVTGINQAANIKVSLMDAEDGTAAGSFDLDIRPELAQMAFADKNVGSHDIDITEEPKSNFKTWLMAANDLTADQADVIAAEIAAKLSADGAKALYTGEITERQAGFDDIVNFQFTAGLLEKVFDGTDEVSLKMRQSNPKVSWTDDDLPGSQMVIPEDEPLEIDLSAASAFFEMLKYDNVNVKNGIGISVRKGDEKAVTIALLEIMDQMLNNFSTQDMIAEIKSGEIDPIAQGFIDTFIENVNASLFKGNITPAPLTADLFDNITHESGTVTKAYDGTDKITEKTQISAPSFSTTDESALVQALAERANTKEFGDFLSLLIKRFDKADVGARTIDLQFGSNDALFTALQTALGDNFTLTAESDVDWDELRDVFVEKFNTEENPLYTGRIIQRQADFFDLTLFELGTGQLSKTFDGTNRVTKSMQVEDEYPTLTWVDTDLVEGDDPVENILEGVSLADLSDVFYGSLEFDSINVGQGIGINIGEDLEDDRTKTALIEFLTLVDDLTENFQTTGMIEQIESGELSADDIDYIETFIANVNTTLFKGEITPKQADFYDLTKFEFDAGELEKVYDGTDSVSQTMQTAAPTVSWNDDDLIPGGYQVFNADVIDNLPAEFYEMLRFDNVNVNVDENIGISIRDDEQQDTVIAFLKAVDELLPDFSTTQMIEKINTPDTLTDEEAADIATFIDHVNEQLFTGQITPLTVDISATRIFYNDTVFANLVSDHYTGLTKAINLEATPVSSNLTRDVSTNAAFSVEVTDASAINGNVTVLVKDKVGSATSGNVRIAGELETPQTQVLTSQLERTPYLISEDYLYTANVTQEWTVTIGEEQQNLTRQQLEDSIDVWEVQQTALEGRLDWTALHEDDSVNHVSVHEDENNSHDGTGVWAGENVLADGLTELKTLSQPGTPEISFSFGRVNLTNGLFATHVHADHTGKGTLPVKLTTSPGEKETNGGKGGQPGKNGQPGNNGNDGNNGRNGNDGANGSMPAMGDDASTLSLFGGLLTAAALALGFKRKKKNS